MCCRNVAIVDDIGTIGGHGEVIITGTILIITGYWTHEIAT